MTGPRLPAAPKAALPADLIVCLHAGARVGAHGRVLTGGSPFRLVQVTAEGAEVLAGWAVPSPVGGGAGRQALAGRLLDGGLLDPHPAPAPTTSGVTFVVPVRDRPEQLARCLAAVRTACPESPVVVVDDGSADAAAVQAVADRSAAQVLRQPVCRGPAAARNAGLDVCTTAFVAFVDSDVVLEPATLARLLGHFADPGLAVVAPRVRALGHARGGIGGYEARHSALDMGPEGGLVAPGRPTGYVPSTMLVVRRIAMGDGFDETLSIGEDVDLVWRLGRAGWRVRYAPEAEVLHDHRVQLGGFLARRHLYARSIGMLARRHPEALPAMWGDPALVLPWCLVAVGCPRAALAAAAGAGLRMQRRLSRYPGSSSALAGSLVTRGLLHTGLALGHAVRRSWAPLLLVAATRRPEAGRVLAAAFATAAVRDAQATRNLPTAASDVPIRLLDEAVAAFGTWEGCLRERTIRPLLPARHPPHRVAAL